MRLLVYEYLSSGALDGQPGAASLAREGLAMLTAVLADLARCPEVVVVQPDRDGDEEATFRRAARQADHALLIAPEFDDLLAQRCAWAIEEGCRLLGPSVEAVRLTADKLYLADHLSRAGLPIIPTIPFTRTPPFPAPWVCKPRFGAGSQATNLVRTGAELATYPEDCDSSERILQPYLPPRDGPVSLACLVGPSQRFPLVLMHQLLSDDGRFTYLGGERVLDLDEMPYRRLALAALDTIPGLAGYIGLDLLWPMGADRPVVVEINPRLTTSYVGLRALTGDNLMQTLIDVVLDRRLASPPAFRGERVRFGADGAIIV